MYHALICLPLKKIKKKNGSCNKYHCALFVLNVFTFLCLYILFLIVINTVLCMQLQALEVVGLIDIAAKHVLGKGVIFYFQYSFVHWQLLSYICYMQDNCKLLPRFQIVVHLIFLTLTLTTRLIQKICATLPNLSHS